MSALAPNPMNLATVCNDPRLRGRACFVAWREERRGGRLTKVPKCARGGNASSTDPDTWATAEDAWEAFERDGHDGIGLVLHEGLGLVALDLDGCRDPANEFPARSQ